MHANYELTQASSDKARYLRIGLAIWLVAMLWAVFPYTREPAGAIKELILREGAALLLLSTLVLNPPGDARRPRLLLLLVAGFAVWNLVSVLQAANMGVGLYASSAVVSLATVSIVAHIAYRSARQVWSTLAVVTIAMIPVSLYGFAQYAGWDPMPWDEVIAEKYSSLRQGPATFGNANYASHALLPVVILATGWAILRRSWIAFLPVLVFLFHFSLTRTRGSMLALLVAAILVGLALAISRTRIAAGLKTLVAPGLLAVVTLVAMATLSYSSSISSAHPVPHDPTFAIRVQTLDGATAMTRERPFFGWGPGNYALENPGFWTEDEQRRFADSGAINHNVHCDPIEVAVATGIPGAALYMTLLALAICASLCMAFSGTCSERRTLGFAGAAAFTGFAIDGWFGFPLHTPVASALIFVLLGALSGVSGKPSIAKNQSPNLRRIYAAAGAGTAVFIAGFGLTDFTSELYEQQGRATMAAGSPDAASKEFDRAVDFAPYKADVRRLAAHAALAAGRPVEALGKFEMAMQLNPGDPLIRLDAARVSLALATETGSTEHLERALSYTEAAATLNPFLPDTRDLEGRAWAMRARIAENGEGWADAESSLLQATALQTEPDPATWRLIASARTAREDLDGAIDALVIALFADPHDERTWRLLESTCRRADNYRPLRQAAGWQLNRLHESGRLTGNAVARAYSRKATALTASGESGEIRETYKRAVTADPEDPGIWEQFLDWAVTAGSLDAFTQALTETTFAVANADQSPLGMAAIRPNASDAGPKSLHDVATTLAVDLRNTWPESDLEDVRKGFRVSGRYLAKRAQTELTGQDLSESLTTAGRALTAGNASDEAISLFDSALELQRGNARVDTLLGKAVALSALDQSSAAVETLEEAVSLDFRRLDVRLALAGAYFDAERWAESKLEYGQVLNQIAPDDPLRQSIAAQIEAIAGRESQP